MSSSDSTLQFHVASIVHWPLSESIQFQVLFDGFLGPLLLSLALSAVAEDFAWSHHMIQKRQCLVPKVCATWIPPLDDATEGSQDEPTKISQHKQDSCTQDKPALGAAG